MNERDGSDVVAEGILVGRHSEAHRVRSGLELGTFDLRSMGLGRKGHALGSMSFDATILPHFRDNIVLSHSDV
jgi:hypothetical protein